MRPAGSGAWLSEDGAYRYALWRCWDGTKAPLVFVMCNPSTANAEVDDPTIRKCVGFAKRGNYGGIIVVNLYAFRATDPAKLKSATLANGPDNDRALTTAMWVARESAATVIVAWGTAARDNGPRYEMEVDNLVVAAHWSGVALQSLKIAKDGVTPCHPLMLPYSSQLQRFMWARKEAK
jgi:hypothetical protein